MNVRAKFDGGKQVNRCQSGSWQARCAGAALRINEGSNWGSEMWSKVVYNPSKTFRAVGECKTKNSIKIGRENQLTLPKLKGKKQRGRAYQLHNKAENITHVMMGEVMKITL